MTAALVTSEVGTDGGTQASGADGGAPTSRTWTLRRRLGMAFLALALVFAALAATLITSNVLARRASNAVIGKWQPALSASQSLLADMVNQETGIRGFLLTNQTAALQPYKQYVAAQQSDSADLHELVSGDAQITPLVDAFDQAAADWETNVARPAIARTRDGVQRGSDAIDAGRPYFNKIRDASRRLTGALQAKLSSAQNARTQESTIFRIVLFVGLGIIALSGLLLWWGMHRWVLRPIDALAGQTRYVAGGDLDAQIRPTGPREFTALGADVEYMRAEIVSALFQSEQVQDELRLKGEELERSNADLQQFAYVASHDLSEPLRKVSNFCQLLERQYGGQLDDRAKQYIWFAVDGAKRMQTLITDLLALSRVGRTTEEFVPVEMGTMFGHAVDLLAEKIRETDGRVELPDTMPAVAGDPSLLGSLAENLVGNALKYHRDDVPPVVTVSVERAAEPGYWLFTVSDNGIGIDPEYGERIFVVFQRLHLRDQYGGTGIGLALCRKIVEFHGGRIWLDHVQSQSGSTFRFTLPEGPARAEHHG